MQDAHAKILRAVASRFTVEDVLDTGEFETVYNMRVEDHHTYFVGTEDWGFSVWAHNTCSSTSSENKGDSNFDNARKARDAELQKIANLPAKERNKVSTVVGGVNTQTGKIAVGVKRSGENHGKCAEDIVVEHLGGNPGDVVMSEAVRPRTGETIPVCTRCQTKYSPGQFPPGTPFGS
jgi:hypothetical protein